MTWKVRSGKWEWVAKLCQQGRGISVFAGVFEVTVHCDAHSTKNLDNLTR